jgi:hypothetical protein
MASLDGTVGTPIALAECDDSAAQRWYFDDTGHGFHRLVGEASNLALEVSDPSLAVGSEIIGGFRRDGDHQAGNLTQAAKWPPQQWRLEMVYDTTAPVVTAGLDQRRRLTVEATDDMSGVAVVEYRLGKKNQPDLGWQVYEGPIQIDAASTVTLRATDAVGNISEELVTSKSELR